VSDERASEELALPNPRVVAGAIFALTLFGFLLTAPKGIAAQHTPFNHFALQAEAWTKGRLDLGGPPPAYTQNNDFAIYQEQTFVSFPPFPALLVLPFVAVSGGSKNVPDGLIFILIAAVAPAVLYLALNRLRETKLSRRSQLENVGLTLLFPFGTVFWFSAVQGTVWFAAHAVGAVLAAGYLFASVRATNPLLAGSCLVLAFATRTPLALMAPIFLQQLWSVARADRAALIAKLIRFAIPIALGLSLIGWYNAARFDSPFEFGHRYLDVVWQPRIQKWGLFSFHYLGKNLGVALASTPFIGDKAAPFQITSHGLALWITSPFFAWALWPRSMPRESRALFTALAVSATLIALADLSYHNTGWVQFGYRFSNDFSLLLFAMIALGRRKLGVTFTALAAFAVAVSWFGAVSFQRPGWERYYRREPVTTYFEPD
jgi:hypothetical protein